MSTLQRVAGVVESTDLEAFAAHQRDLFAGMNLHVGRSRTVHRVTWIDWIDGLTLPAPACRQGFAGHGMHAELRATRWPITCRRACCRSADCSAPVSGELALFEF